MRDGSFRRTDIWREGKWIDLWSVVHFLSGSSVAFAIAWFGFGYIPSTVIAFLLFVAYELWEAMVKIEETPQNRFMDVVVGMASFIPTLFWLQGLPEQYFFPAFGFVLVINITLATIGWYASQKAKEFEHRLRSEFTAQRARLKERRIRIREAMRRRRPPTRGI